MADGYISQIKTPDNKTYLLKDSESVHRNSELLTTNPFTPTSLKGPYISKIDNAFYAANKRWQITATNLSYGGVEALFDGNYESQARISGTDAAIITMDFDPEHTNVAEKNKYFPGYPYGYILISFYNPAGPASISGRVYCNYSAHGIGWHNLTFSPISDNTAYNIVYRSDHQGYYNMAVLEITINGNTSNSYGYTAITQIEMHLDRPNSKLTPFLSKYGDETLYYNLTAPKFIGALQGNADTTTKFNSTRKIELTGAITGSATTDGSSGWTISTTVNHNHDSRYKIASGVITLGSNTITPITSIADLTGSTITAVNLRTNLGLTAALRFIGKATTDINESTTTAPTVTGITNYTPEVGDVILDKNSDEEYVCIAKTTTNNTTTYTWELLGRSGSWATSTHTHGNITNGGLLGAANMAVVTDGSKKITTADLSVNDPTVATTTSTTFIDTISQNAQGKITATKKTLPTLTSVTQSSNSEDKEFPIILKNTNNSTNETNGVKYDGDVTVNPSKSKITATTIQANSRLVASKAISQIITGTGTAGSYTNNTYHPAKWTFNTGLTATDGDIFTIKIPVAGHDYGVFMSVDNGSHYYPVVLNGTERITTHYPINTYITVIFEPTGSAASMYALAGQTSSTRTTVTGGVWRVLNYRDTNSNDIGYYHRRIYPNLKAGGAIHPYSIIMQLPNGRWSGITTTAPNNPGKGKVSPVATGKTANASGFMLGHVLLMYANTTYADANNIGTYNIWSAYTGLIDARYSFNLANSTGNGFVAYTPVYIVGTVSDGLFHLDTTKWWTQTLPSSDDGKVYIYIGDAYDWYRLTFTEDKPIYWYKDGAVRLYSGASEYALDAGTVNGLTVQTAVPSNAIFTDTNKYHKSGSWSDLTYTATAVNGADELKFTIPNKIQTNWELNATSGNSPALLFTRDGELTDWRIIVTSGRLSFQSATDAATWTERAYFKDNTGDFVATSFTGKGSALTDLNASSLSSGTVPVARLPLATTSAAGVVKIGSGISVSDGTISVTATNLGLSNALHFIGITSTTLTDGSTTATLTAKSTNSLSKTTGFVDGDVVMDGDQLREYVWSGSAWRLLGITTSTKYEKTTSGNTFISKVTQATDGTITAESRELNTSGTWSGNAATATAIETAGTTAQFYRGDNSWSNTIKQTANATLGIDNLKIGTARKDLNFDIANGSGTGINDGYAGGITWGSGNAAYAGIYYQTSGNYGSRLIFGTTGSYANGVYARMIVQSNGKIGIGTLTPSELLHVTGNLLLGNSGSKSIYYQGTKSKNSMITFLDNTSDANGNGIKIGGGGVVVVGAGESAANLSVTPGVESLYLTADGNVNIEAGGDTIANRIGMQVTSSGHIIPVKAEAENSNAQNLGASDSRWAKLYIGTTDSYGDAYTPIYWHEGVPTVVTLTQQCAFTIKSGKSGVKLSHTAITANSYVTQIVVTSGEANLNSAISWTSAAGYIELTCSSTVSGDVTGYIMVSRGGEITATATDIA